MLNTKRTQTKQICRFFPLTANTKLPCVRKIIAIPPFANHHSLYAEISSNDTIFYCLAPSFKPTCHLEASGAALVASQCQVTALWQQGKCTPAPPGSCPSLLCIFSLGTGAVVEVSVSQGQGHLFPLNWRRIPSILYTPQWQHRVCSALHDITQESSICVSKKIQGVAETVLKCMTD